MYEGDVEPQSSGKRESKIEMRMIDFAHCVSNVDEIREVAKFPPTTYGPDNGYLLGLKNLRECFEEIWAEFGKVEYDVLKEKRRRRKD